MYIKNSIINEPPHDKTNKVTAPSEDSDQPRFRSAWADLSPRWAHTQFVGFVMSWLK